ncbi:MAG: cobaltochelatase subunit CobN [Methanomassiliicoccus sp.]|nr:cobaltochelatase subunit CobN [Methanomassiliicoccus sp.]
MSAGTKDSAVMLSALEDFLPKAGQVQLVCVDSEDLDSKEKEFLSFQKIVKKADLLIVRIHGDPSYFKKFDRLKETVLANKVCCLVACNENDVASQYRDLFPYSDADYHLIRAFVELGGKENDMGILAWACKTIDGMTSIEVPEPSRPRTEGIYHPDHGTMIDPIEYLSTLKPGRPTIGVMFHQTTWLSGNLEAINEIIWTLEKKGANVIPVFFVTSPSSTTGSIGIRSVFEKYFMDGDRPRVDSVIMNMGFSQISLSNPGDGSSRMEVHNFFQDLDVPILQTMSVWKDREAYEGDINGLSAMEISVNVVWPEYDGQIITVPISCNERTRDGRLVAIPMADRIERVATLAKSWAELRRTAVDRRKVAILLYMYPPKNDRVGGAAGLDTFQSISDILKEMEKAGYYLDHVPSDGKELLDEIMAGVTNDTEWLSPQEIKERAADSVGKDRYRDWFDNIPTEAQDAICRNWGEPPGILYNIDGRLMIPGVKNGNVFIGLQPNRGYHAQAETLYHSTDVVMPHQYLAYYRWLKDVFGAQAVIHMGCHGTLEWLPGKSVGLSAKCYPDVVLGSMPNLNPYIMENPGEGIQAKRRSGAVILDHLIPAMTRAGSYDDLMDLESNVQAYLRASNTGQMEKLAVHNQNIYAIVKRLSMFEEIGLPMDAAPEDFDNKIDKLYDYLLEMKDALIKDGLHIMGRPPEDKRLEEMLYCLTRLQNGSVPSLRAAVAETRGLEIRELQDNPSQMHPTLGKVNGSLLDEVDGQCHDIIDRMMGVGFTKAECQEIVREITPGNNADLAEVVTFLCDEVYPNVMATSNEVRYLLHGLDGGYVPPGPSGCPTRGNAHLLPTGRNFYSIDPDSIPSPASWEIGKKMADQMVERHVKEMGCYPMNVGMVVWATDTMKTGGDDIAYILWLMGLRPKWSATGSRVIGLEVIQLKDLGRPRIDVTLRISGLFRDTFPNLVDMIDEGVETIASLDESEDENFIVKHLREDIQQSIREGLSPKDAQSKALVRIFGDPPGEYGAGVDVLIESSKWSTTKDLADTYVTWGCHAYGRGWKGEKLPDSFKQRMGALDVTVKNHEDREFDLLDIDDDYTILGGMNATVRVFGGKKPLSVMGDSSDPQRLKTRTLEEESKFVFRSRVLNPKWLEGLKQHGFRGAQELSKLTEYVLGWDATSDIIEPWMYESLTEHFLFDEENRKWIEESNPYALREMASRLLEAIERGLWEASEEIKEKLKQIYLDAESVLEEANEGR